jgi:hypothetical protein
MFLCSCGTWIRAALAAIGQRIEEASTNVIVQKAFAIRVILTGRGGKKRGRLIAPERV